MFSDSDSCCLFSTQCKIKQIYIFDSAGRVWREQKKLSLQAPFSNTEKWMYEKRWIEKRQIRKHGYRYVTNTPPHTQKNSTKCYTYLIVPVGEGNGDPKLVSWSGMLILSGCILRLGGDGTLAGGGSKSSTSDWNWILMFVLGKRSVHLQRKQNGTES